MTHSENGKELTKQAVAEHFRSAARLQELEADATTPWVKRYLRSLMEERERMVGRARGIRRTTLQFTLVDLEFREGGPAN
jgi:hypothetical protein